MVWVSTCAETSVFATFGKPWAHAHWGKIELPDKDAADYRLRLVRLRRHVHERYNVDAFNRAREMLDPKHVLSNGLIKSLFDRA